jgi:ribulose-phosphate 3-epimerase
MSRSATRESLRRSLPLIAPSMLKCDFGNLHREVELLESAGAELLHWDVMDGHFVPNLSYGALLIEKVRPRTEMWFDAHLMISEPGRYVDEYVKAGCQSLTIHIEAVPEPRDLLQHIRKSGCLAGLSLNPDTPVERIIPLLDVCDMVLVMSVQPGFGGQKFQPRALEKVRILRQQGPEGLLIAIDGGICPETVAPSSEAGCDLFVVGSAIFEAPDYGAALRDLRQRAVQGRTGKVS